MKTAEAGPLVFEDRALGSRLRLSLTGADGMVAERAWDAVRAEFDGVDRSLSGFRADSEISRVNVGTPGAETRVGDRLYGALALADRAWRVTGGRFDPRVHDALRRLGQPGPIGPPMDRRSGLGSGSPWVSRCPRTRRVAVAEPVDLHGVGKGLALRWSWRAVERLLPAAAGALLEAGGDLVGRGPSGDGGPWLIGIEDPRGRRDPLAVVALARGAICTSSTRISRWVDPTGRERHHLIDPATAVPADGGLQSVTIAAPDAAWAEIRTKELFVAGRARIGDRARGLGLAAWWVTDDGVLEMTPHARLVTRWP